MSLCLRIHWFVKLYSVEIPSNYWKKRMHISELRLLMQKSDAITIVVVVIRCYSTVYEIQLNCRSWKYKSQVTPITPKTKSHLTKPSNLQGVTTRVIKCTTSTLNNHFFLLGYQALETKFWDFSESRISIWWWEQVAYNAYHVPSL